MSSTLIRAYGRVGNEALRQWPTISCWTNVKLFFYENILHCHMRIGGEKG